MNKLSIEIKCGELELTLSGSVVTTTSDVHMTLYDDGIPLDIFMEFKNDDNDKKFRREASVIEGKNTIKLVFINYNDALGTYTTQPWRIGHSFNKELFLCYIIYGFSNSNVKKLDYSFYLGKEVKNG